MKDAIAQDAVLAKHDQSLSRGDIEAGVQSADYLLEGTMQTGGQEHFYLEPQCAIAIPHEDDEMEIICSTQSASFTQVNSRTLLGTAVLRTF